MEVISSQFKISKDFIQTTCRQQILLRVWGEQDSASILQLHHFTYSIGAFLAPLLVSGFYNTDENTQDELCGRDNGTNRQGRPIIRHRPTFDNA